ncbi:hydrolase [Streptococcus moroccensis]|uniref:CheY-like chemotaxis protein n=1 Tax=Streptococcus moroccensis TaxID=1451356 RepID=A0ABT9YRS8_9STRE|nr:hydrolase [Streptococcus moroccensis]MDQ0222701.1 CheY-like chemotaxis protein [Streptococcus moroccensis]
MTEEAKLVKAPKVMSDLRQDIVKMPKAIWDCSGIKIYGRLIRAVIFTTDVAIIANTNADAVLAVYPFTPSPAIAKSIMSVANIPVFAGVGGGLTKGYRSANMSLFSESEGAMAVVTNGPTSVETIERMNEMIDIPIIYTVVSEHSDIASRLKAGVDILNISGGERTIEMVAKIRQQFPDVPIMATGGPNEETIRAVIAAGANAVTYTPPSNGELFKHKMEKYRHQEDEAHRQD